MIDTDSDGIVKAEMILKFSGAKIEKGMIIKPIRWNLSQYTLGDIGDSIDFLVYEWDYGVIDE